MTSPELALSPAFAAPEAETSFMQNARRYGMAVLAATALALVASPNSEAQASVANSPVESTSANLYTNTTPEASAALSQSTDPQTFGKNQVNSIFGLQVNFQQPVTGVEVAPGSTRTNYVCPPVGTKLATPAVASTTILSGNKASVTFCASDKKVKVSTPIFGDSAFSSAFGKLQSDTRRSGEFGGDDYETNLYTYCPSNPKQQAPEIKFTYKSKSQSATASYNVAVDKYCNEVGQSSNNFNVQVRKGKKGSWKDAGREVVEIAGVREVISQYGGSAKNNRDKVKLTETGKLCKPGSKTQMRVKMVQNFVADRTQKFVRSFDGTTNRMRNGSKTYYSPAKNICK